MTSLNSLYSKDKSRGLVVNKTFFVPMKELYIEDGFNIRELDTNHIDALAESYTNGEALPPLTVEVTATGIKIIDGHHRYKAALKAGLDRIECKNFAGDETDKIVLMIKSSQGKNLEPMERAKGYLRLKNQGLKPDEIAKRVGRSRGDVDNHLMLMEAPAKIQKAVKDGKVSYATAVGEIRKSGTKAEAKIEKAVKKAEKSGEKKAKIPTFPKAKFIQVMEILAGYDLSDFDEELKKLVNEYVEVKGD